MPGAAIGPCRLTPGSGKPELLPGFSWALQSGPSREFVPNFPLTTWAGTSGGMDRRQRCNAAKQQTPDQRDSTGIQPHGRSVQPLEHVEPREMRACRRPSGCAG